MFIPPGEHTEVLEEVEGVNKGAPRPFLGVEDHIRTEQKLFPSTARRPLGSSSVLACRCEDCSVDRF